MNRVIVLAFLSLTGCSTHIFSHKNQAYDSYLQCGETKLYYWLSLSDEQTVKLRLKDGESQKLTSAIPYEALPHNLQNQGLYEFKKSQCALKQIPVESLTK